MDGRGLRLPRTGILPVSIVAPQVPVSAAKNRLCKNPEVAKTGRTPVLLASVAQGQQLRM